MTSLMNYVEDIFNIRAHGLIICLVITKLYLIRDASKLFHCQ